MDTIYNTIYSYVDLYSISKLPPNKYTKLYHEKFDFVKKNYPEKLIDLFTLEKMINFPILKFKPKFIGSTDYIDRIKPCDLSHPIMIGIDCFNRPFVSIRTSCLDTGDVVVDTLFQRYSDDKFIWSSGCCGYGFINNSGHINFFVNKEEKNMLSENISRLLVSNPDIMYPSYFENLPYVIKKTILY